MKKLILTLGIAFLAACNLDMAGMEALDDYAGDIAASGQVDSVICQPVTLDLATKESGMCIALNAVGTRLSTSGTNVVMWSSSAPSTVSVDLTGMIVAETQVGSAWIRAEGTMGSVDSIQVTVN